VLVKTAHVAPKVICRPVLGVSLAIAVLHLDIVELAIHTAAPDVRLALAVAVLHHLQAALRPLPHRLSQQMGSAGQATEAVLASEADTATAAPSTASAAPRQSIAVPAATPALVPAASRPLHPMERAVALTAIPAQTPSLGTAALSTATGKLLLTLWFKLNWLAERALRIAARAARPALAFALTHRARPAPLPLLFQLAQFRQAAAAAL
jgi:hypothetical protein